MTSLQFFGGGRKRFMGFDRRKEIPGVRELPRRCAAGSTSWHQAASVPREERRLPDVAEPAKLHCEPFKPDGQSPVGRHPVLEHVQVESEILGIQAESSDVFTSI